MLVVLCVQILVASLENISNICLSVSTSERLKLLHLIYYQLETYLSAWGSLQFSHFTPSREPIQPWCKPSPWGEWEVAPPNIPHRAGAVWFLYSPTFAGIIFALWYGETVIYWDTAQHLYPPMDQTPASRVFGENDDHSATETHSGIWNIFHKG